MTEPYTMEKAKERFRAGPAPIKGGEWIMEPTFDETRQVIGNAFAGSGDVQGEPLSDWACEHMDTSWYTPKMHQHNLRFGIGFSIYKAMVSNPQKTLVVSKREEDGHVASVAVVVAQDEKTPPSQCSGQWIWNNAVDSWGMLVAFWEMQKSDGVPKLYTDRSHKADSDHYTKIIDGFEKECARLQEQERPKERHWYIKLVGIDPKANGKGYGRELVEKVSSLADEEGMACYLESGERSVGFYKKMGFEILSSMVIRDPIDPSRQPLEGFVMLRQPKK